ncbi:glycoside hydrolase family 32 protein [Kribbella sp. NBC_00662]|uniref:glycoside hydrolase family 32 protein n=1 Tax=Kribbella sp. NBC_00662 TaxID=2975969 RepID=UPI0032490FE4
MVSLILMTFPYPETDYREDNRGQVHFSSRSGWMNDVNGPVYYRGVYHLYYQHAPNSLVWDTMHWGHATSTDLVHWTQQPIALDPQVHPGDLWSGGGVVDTKNVSGLKNGDDDPILVYSGTNGVTVFYSLDGGNTFASYADGKKVVTPGGTSRDPKVFWDPVSETWGMVVWSDEGGNGVDFFTSVNLLDWAFASRYPADWLFECPNLIRMPIDDEHRWVLHAGSGKYVIGEWDGTTYHSDWIEPQKINQTETFAGAGYYAALNFENVPNGRIVSMAWQGENKGSIWTGNASFPVDLTLHHTDNGIRVFSTPIPELASLRTSSETWEDLIVADGTRQLPAGSTYELEATVDVSRATRFTLNVGREVTYEDQHLDGAELRPIDGKIKLHLLVDRDQLDVFGNDGAVYQSYNVRPTELELTAKGRAAVEQLTIHQLGSIWR